MSKNILVIGASGYIGSQLIPVLLEKGHKVRALVRNRKKISVYDWHIECDIREGDVLDSSFSDRELQNINIVYYLLHSMGNPKGDFTRLDRLAARKTADMSRSAGVDRIIYLGGLGRRDIEQSLHLKSRHEVGDILRTSSVPVTEFRAAVIIGAGSFSFEMVHHLTNRLPVMICPRWVITRTQPISIDDVIRYLAAAIDTPESSGRIIDIGGPEVLTYRDMMLTVARVLGLKRWLIQVPVLTPRLSSYWVGLVTPIPIQPARALIEGVRHETICENDYSMEFFDIQPCPFEAAVRKALSAVLPESRDTEENKYQSIIKRIEPSHILTDRQQTTINAPVDRVFNTVASIGGENGWYYADWLWKIRGLIDELCGGVGLRRGRRDDTALKQGEALDFWRVEELDQGQRLLLRAEMKVPGKAWLEFEVSPIDHKRCHLIQTARFYPRGLAGIFYWYGIYPVHSLVFKGLVSAIARKASVDFES